MLRYDYVILVLALAGLLTFLGAGWYGVGVLSIVIIATIVGK